MALGDERQKLAFRKGGGAVEKLRPHRDGHAREHEHMLAFGGGNKPLQGLLRRIQEQLLPEQVAAGIACDAKFGKDEKFDAFFRRLLHALFEFFCIISGIPGLQVGGKRPRPHESVFHTVGSSSPETVSTGLPLAAARIFISISLASSALSFKNWRIFSLPLAILLPS